MDELKKAQIKAICLSAVCIVSGILFCAIPSKTLGLIETLVCVVFLVVGVVSLIGYCLMNSETKSWTLFIQGAVLTTLGLLIMFVNSLFVICLGVLLAVSGAVYIKSSIDDKKSGDKTWWVALIIGILIVFAGIAVAILYNTEIAKNIVMRIFGISLLFDGIVRIIYIFIAHKEFHALISLKKKREEDIIEADFEVVRVKEEIKQEFGGEQLEEKPKKEKEEKSEQPQPEEDEGGFV